jgi:hypothetical protein
VCARGRAYVRNSSLLARDFKAGQLPAGPTGPRGATGATGARGAAGTNGFGLLTYPVGSDVVADGVSTVVTADCPPGTSATGGDAFALDATDTDVTNRVLTAQGFNFKDPIGWIALVTNTTGGDVTVLVHVACANADRVTIESTKRRLRR